MGKTLLDLIESRFGKVTAFDGRLCAWTGSVPRDIRDLAKALKTDSGSVADCMPVFEAPKRGRRSAAVSEEKDESGTVLLDNESGI